MRSAAAALVLASFVSFVASVSFVRESAASAGAQQPFRSGVDLVNLGVTVTDKKGNLVADLTPEDFEIVEDGKVQAVRYFSGGDGDAEPPPMHLGLMLDVSESMGEDMRFTKTASIKFLNTLTDAVDITVVDFDTEVRAARYSQNEFARLIERIRQKKAGGFTALYDAVGVYLDGAGSQDGRKIMLLYTDGGDTRSSIRFGELMDLLKASDVTVYPIGELEHQSSSGRAQQRMLLQQMADVTGGQAFFPTTVKELDVVYDKVVAEIRAQYTIGYLSTNEKTDGAWRKVEVKVKRKDLRVRSRRGYFATYRKP
jgi:Ca-activated chloride channel family protein